MSWLDELTKAGSDLFSAHLDHAVERYSPSAQQRIDGAGSPAANQSASEQAPKKPTTANEARNTTAVKPTAVAQPAPDYKKWALIGAGGVAVLGLIIWGVKS